MTKNEYDIAIIGGGPGGYVAAIKAAQLGLKTLCIEKNDTLGGTCLNVGCIPSKALLKISHDYFNAKKSFGGDTGISIEGVKLNLTNVMKSKSSTVEGLTKGIQGLFAKNKVTRIIGHASFVNSQTISVKTSKGDVEEVVAKNIIIATGSVPTSLPNITIDEKNIVSSTGALDFKEVPKTLGIIGAGVIGVEMAQIWSSFGVKVTIFEYGNEICSGFDKDVSDALKKILTSKYDIEFKMNTGVTDVKNDKKFVTVKAKNNDTGKEEEYVLDKLLISVGRKPNTENLGLDNLGIPTNERGFIETNDKLQTKIPNIYAIGDVTTGPMLAHKAEEDGIAAVENILGQAGHVNYNLVPSVVYTHPEVASVGKTEKQLKAEGMAYNVGKFSMMANSRARAVLQSEGFVKILADKETDEILGAQIIGESAGELIGEITVGMEFRAASEDIARICHAHPTLSEAVKEASLATYFKPIHS